MLQIFTFFKSYPSFLNLWEDFFCIYFLEGSLPSMLLLKCVDSCLIK